MDLNLLISVIGGLGRVETTADGQLVFCKDEDCLDCLKDLQRFLREDDPRTRDAFFTIGQYKTARTDLVPLITTYAGDTDIVYNALKVVTFLTMPVEEDSEKHSLQVEAMLDIKDAFLAQDALAVVVALVGPPLMRHAERQMTDKDLLIVQLVITFLRNLIVIPDSSGTSGSSGSHRSAMRGKLLSRLFADSALELLLVMAQHTAQGLLRAEAPLLLEIFAALFETVDPKALVDASSTPTANLPPAQPPLAPHQAQQRHPRFGGIFVSRLEGGRARCSVGKSQHQDVLGHVAASGKLAGTTKADGCRPMQLDADMLMQLRSYAEAFLEGSYNILMGSVRKELEPGLNISRLSSDDFLRFFRVANFFTTFVRLQQEHNWKREKQGDHTARPDESPFSCISATMGWETFHLVQSLWLTAIDLPTAAAASSGEKWELQHASLLLLKEMLFTLDLAHQAGNALDRKASDRLQRRLLHDDQKESGLLPVLSRLIKQFVFKYQSKEHAKDLVQALHVVLRLLERLSRNEAGGFLVQRKAAAVRKRKAAKEDADGPMGEAQTGSAEADEGNTEVVSPAAQQPSAEQEGPGAQVADKADAGDTGSEAGVQTPFGLDGRQRQDPLDDRDDEEIQEHEHRLKEVAWNLQQRVRQELAYPVVLHFYSWLLQGYATNGRFVNHCLVAFLQRVADPSGINMEPMLYQVSILRLFQQMLSDRTFRSYPGSSEVLGFAASIVRRVFDKLIPRLDETAQLAAETGKENEHNNADDSAAKEQRLLKEQAMSSMTFVELLFWKNTRDAEEVREEYGWKVKQKSTHVHMEGDASGDELSGGVVSSDRQHPGPQKKPAKTVQAFSAEQRAELEQLFEKHGAQKGSVIDAIAADLAGGVFKRSQVQRQLKEMGLKKGVLTENQKSQLQELFHKHKGTRSCLARIAEELPGGFRRGQVSKHLRQLGLQLKKKRTAEQAATSSGSGNSQQKVSQRREGARMELAPLPSFSDDHQSHESASDLSEEEDSDAASGPPSRPAEEQPSIRGSQGETAKGGTLAVHHTPATGPSVARQQARPASAESGPSGSMPGSRKRTSVQDCEVSENGIDMHSGSKRRSLGRASPSDEGPAPDAGQQAAASPLAPRAAARLSRIMKRSAPQEAMAAGLEDLEDG